MVLFRDDDYGAAATAAIAAVAAAVDAAVKLTLGSVRAAFIACLLTCGCSSNAS